MRQVRIGDIQISQDEKDAVNRVLDSNWLSEGSQVKQFEKDWANYCGTKYCVAVNSGTSALMVGLEALKHCNHHPKSEEGKKILTSPLTYIATVNSIKLTNYKPEFADINIKDFSLDAEKVKEHFEKNDPHQYSAIMPVHLMGYPCDMYKINKIAKENGLAVIEDSCEAHGSRLGDKKTGAMGDFGAFSFFIAHNIQVGELGAVTTDDLELVRYIDKVKAHGRTCHLEGCEHKELFFNTEHEIDHHPRYFHDIPGFNFKTTEIQGALAVQQVKKADWIIKRRLENVSYLNNKLAEFSNILTLPEYNENVSYIGYPLVIKDSGRISRAKLRKELGLKGIETRPLFGSIPSHQPVYRHMRERYHGTMPNAEKVGSDGFYIGCQQYLQNDDLDYVAESFKDIFSKL